MSAPLPSARERILETTATLLRRQGYHATGLNQIIDESQAPKGSLYHYFPGGKEELAAEAVQLAAIHNVEKVAMAVGAAGDTRSALKLIANAILGNLKASNFQEACPISTVALETSAISSTLQHVCSEAFTSLFGVIEKSLLDDGYTAEEARAWGNMMVCTYLGGILLSRTHHDTWPLEEAFRTIGEVLPPPKRPRKRPQPAQ